MTTFKPLAIALALTSLFWLGSMAKSAEPKTPTTQVLHRTVKIDGLDVFYREAGAKDAPTILLLHGLPYTGRNFRDSRECLRAAFGQSVEAGLSVIDLGGILSNVANKYLLEGFFSVERVWRNICAVRNVSDFKTVTSYRLIGKDQYEQVAPGGELKSGTLGNELYSNKADTYGLILNIDRRDLINDDLGAITTVPRKLGRGSGLKINDVFWTTFLNNTAFFSVPNKNYVSGADTALGT